MGDHESEEPQWIDPELGEGDDFIFEEEEEE